MTNKEQSYDGALISELGVKRYLRATKDIKTSNINFLIRGVNANRAWQECNFGCHGPTYRVLKRPSTKGELLKPLDDISPILGGTIDGIQHQTIGQVDRLAGGVKRTAEGLHLTGKENFQNVGEENTAAYQFATSTFEKLITFEIDVLENPLTQIIMAIVSEYTTALPEWLIEETLKQGALKFPTKIDAAWLLKAAALGIIENASPENIEKAVKLLNGPAQHLVAKQLGKILATVIASAIASAITKSIMAKSTDLSELKRQLTKMRRSARQMNGSLGKAVLTLLDLQGYLNKAAESSRLLKMTNPRVWNILRFKLNGANMAYFLVETMVQEYIDRLALLEKNPKEFGKIMETLIKEKRTNSIFFPGTN